MNVLFRGEYMECLETNKRNGEIDLLRLIFSIIILIYHWNAVFDFGIFENGYIGVEFFFLVSGYLMAANAKKSKKSERKISSITWNYIINKVKKFFPYYCFILIFQLVLKTILTGGGIKSIVLNLVVSIPTFTLTFMGSNNNYVTMYVGNTWFLSALIIATFILYPLLLKSYDSCTKIAFPIIALFGIGYLYCSYSSISDWNTWNGFCYTGIIRAISELALGASLCELSTFLRDRYRRISFRKKLLFSFVKIACYSVVIGFAMGVGSAQEDIHAMLFCAIGIVLTFSGITLTIPSNQVTLYFGRISLPIFIFHGFMRTVVSDYMKGSSISYGMFALFIAGSICASIALMYFVDLIAKLLHRVKNSHFYSNLLGE